MYFSRLLFCPANCESSILTSPSFPLALHLVCPMHTNIHEMPLNSALDFLTFSFIFFPSASSSRKSDSNWTRFVRNKKRIFGSVRPLSLTYVHKLGTIYYGRISVRGQSYVLLSIFSNFNAFLLSFPCLFLFFSFLRPPIGILIGHMLMKEDVRFVLDLPDSYI